MNETAPSEGTNRLEDYRRPCQYCAEMLTGGLEGFTPGGSSMIWRHESGHIACGTYENATGERVSYETHAIVSPGKFEGEGRYMPTAYQMYVNGMADDDGNTLAVTFGPEFREVFPELWENGREGGVVFTVTDQGFVEEI